MHISRSTELHAATKIVECGLLANGSSGSWDVAVDESVDGPQRWWLQLDGSTVSMRLEIPSASLIDELIRFMEAKMGQNGSAAPLRLQLSAASTITAVLIRDDEFADRFFLNVGEPDDPAIRWTIAGNEVGDLLEALRQTWEDIRN